MAIERSDPTTDLVRLRESMNRMFSAALARASADARESGAAWTPPLDLIEEPERYLLRADLPGIAPGAVEIKVEDGRLVLRGERRPDESETREIYLRAERPHGPFALHLALPPSVDARRIAARHANGVIEVVLPKRGAAATTTIPVAAG